MYFCLLSSLIPVFVSRFSPSLFPPHLSHESTIFLFVCSGGSIGPFVLTGLLQSFRHNSNELVRSISREAITIRHCIDLRESHQSIISLRNIVYPAAYKSHISCFGHTIVVLNCSCVICFSIMGVWFNLLQKGKCCSVRVFLQVEVRLDKNIVPLSYKARTQTDWTVDSASPFSQSS